MTSVNIMGEVGGDPVEPRTQVGPAITVATDVFDGPLEDLSHQFLSQIGIAHPVVEIAEQPAVVAVIDGLPGLFVEALGAFDQGEFIALFLPAKGVVQRANDGEK